MSDKTTQRIDREVKRICSDLSSYSRPFEPGCVIRIPLSDFSDKLHSDKSLTHIYGAVGREVDYCGLITSRSYNAALISKTLSYLVMPFLYYISPFMTATCRWLVSPTRMRHSMILIFIVFFTKLMVNGLLETNF